MSHPFLLGMSGRSNLISVLEYCELLRRPLSSWLAYIKCYIRHIDTESMHELTAVTLYNVPVTIHSAVNS